MTHEFRSGAYTTRWPAGLPEANMPECGPDEWLIHMASWIIQDGNYGEFSIGETRPFALEFWTDRLAEGTLEQQVTQIGASYDVNGALTKWGAPHTRSVCLDFGPLSAYNAHHVELPWAHVRGLVTLGIDPFDYFERLGQLPGAPPLVYDWRVIGLYRQTAPYLEVAPSYFERDLTALGWEAIGRTDAWGDEHGSAEYLIRATPLGEARRTLETRG